MTRNINSYLDQDIIGLESPITFDADYKNRGMVQQLIDMIKFEATQPLTQHRLWLDEMSSVARISLYKILTDLQAAIPREAIETNGGGPFAATTGWADSGAEAANNALSVAGGDLVATMTAGTGGVLAVYHTLTTVIGVRYRCVFTDLVIAADSELRASNATALTAPLATELVDFDDTPFASASLEFVATATTTYVGVYIPATPDGVVLDLGAFSVDPVVPLP